MTENFSIEPPNGLLEKIMKRIHREERILVFKRTALFSVTFIASVVGLYPALKMLISDFSQSGFFNFFSLMFSDFSVVTTYWQSFVMILLQTLPAVSLALFLAVLLTLFQSAVYLTKNVKIIINNNLATN